MIELLVIHSNTKNHLTLLTYVYKSFISFMYKPDLALNNQQWLMCQKTKKIKPILLTITRPWLCLFFPLSCYFFHTLYILGDGLFNKEADTDGDVKSSIQKDKESFMILWLISREKRSIYKRIYLPSSSATGTMWYRQFLNGVNLYIHHGIKQPLTRTDGSSAFLYTHTHTHTHTRTHTHICMYVCMYVAEGYSDYKPPLSHSTPHLGWDVLLCIYIYIYIYIYMGGGCVYMYEWMIIHIYICAAT